MRLSTQSISLYCDQTIRALLKQKSTWWMGLFRERILLMASPVRLAALWLHQLWWTAKLADIITSSEPVMCVCVVTDVYVYVSCIEEGQQPWFLLGERSYDRHSAAPLWPHFTRKTCKKVPAKLSQARPTGVERQRRGGRVRDAG